jgi:hypothetical protein
MKLTVRSFIAGNTSRIVHVANLAHCHQRVFLSDIEVKLHHGRFGVIPLIRINGVILMAASHSASSAGMDGSIWVRVEVREVKQGLLTLLRFTPTLGGSFCRYACMVPDFGLKVVSAAEYDGATSADKVQDGSST